MEEVVDTADGTRQYLSFLLDGECFAISVARVREIIGNSSLTRIPRMPDFMSGVINLRGSVVPVIDMCLKLGIGQVKETVDSCIVVIEAQLDGETIVVGALVDAVQEVFEMELSQMEPPPKMGTRLDTTFIEGMGRRDNVFVILLDPDHVFSVTELEAAQSAGQSIGDVGVVEMSESVE